MGFWKNIISVLYSWGMQNIASFPDLLYTGPLGNRAMTQQGEI